MAISAPDTSLTHFMNMNSIVCTVKPTSLNEVICIDNGIDIPNANPEVHIQHVAEKFDQTCNCCKHIPCNGDDYHRAPMGGNINPSAKKIMSLQDLEAVCRVNAKYLNGMHMVLHFRN